MATVASSLDRRPAPGPRGNLLLGNMLDLQRDPLAFLVGCMHEYGPIFRVRLFGSIDWHVVVDSDAIEQILVTNANNNHKGKLVQQLTRCVTGDGLASSEGEPWKRQRRLMQPAFRRQRLAVLTDQIGSAAARWADRWDARQTDQPFDLAAEMTHLTLGIVGRTLFSIDTSAAADTVLDAMTTIQDYTGYRLLHPLSPPEFVPTPRNRRYRAAVATLDGAIADMIAERRRSTAEHHDLLAMLMDARDEGTGDGLSDRELRDQIRTIMFAGHETIAAALSWTWYLLSQHPAIEQQLHAEVDQVLAGRTPTFADLPRLQYTKMVLEESMRIYPSAWIMVRQSIADDLIGGYHVPGKAFVGISPYVIHRNPAYWERPDVFDPLRFTPERVAQRPRFAYMPFGGGRHVCIGNQFAMMEGQLVLATLAQRYRFARVSDERVQPEVAVSIRPKNGLMMRLQQRERARSVEA